VRLAQRRDDPGYAVGVGGQEMRVAALLTF
jgi:hypothetical protein